MAADVPAYKKFLKARSLTPSAIKSIADIDRIPSMGKDSYLRAYAYKDLFWGGALKVPHVMTSTSGSTGEPFYFARSYTVDEQSALVHERFFLQSNLSKTKPTLVVVCFGMGVWIGGLITYQAFQLLGKRGHPISVITPGINKNEILKVLQRLAPEYDQLILAGYPPFIKDVLDEAAAAGISLKKYKMAIVFAAEAFTERFREYIAWKAGIKDPLRDTMNIYGSADLGTMAAETPLSILIRRLALSHQGLYKELFGDISKTPTLAQYTPEFTHFEAADGQLLVTGDSAMPLCRYLIGDNGGVYEFADFKNAFKRHGIDLQKQMRSNGIEPALTQLPFVYVYERSDLSTTLYGLQIYPETIRESLLAETYTPFLTGRFTLMTKFNDEHDQFLEINLELHKDKEASKALAAQLGADMVKNLREKNGEFRELHDFLGERAVPRLVFWPHEDPLYFRRDIKQKWVLRTG
ncbi:MAG TPA: hypothetical protein VG102_02015 [Candidatus Paceibacterota bacterium]|jgi:phenylacetate-CoA ligase|nr:hypothetical protein [Candidatus Paceibacterota bacterium]